MLRNLENKSASSLPTPGIVPGRLTPVYVGFSFRICEIL